MEVSARIPLVDPRPALVVARRWESAAPGASLESEGAYLDRVEWVARRFAHVPNHVRCAAREYPVCSLSISRSIRILSIAFGGRAAMLVRVELPWILGPYLYLQRTNEGSERSCRSALCNPLPGERRPPRGEITQTWCLACNRSMADASPTIEKPVLSMTRWRRLPVRTRQRGARSSDCPQQTNAFSLISWTGSVHRLQTSFAD